jgi:hypothetical protein
MARKSLYELRVPGKRQADPQTTNKTLEKIMSMHHSLAAALWLLTAVGAYTLVASWADGAQSGKVHPWVLVIVFWGAALVSMAIHHLSLYLSKCLAQGQDAFRRYRAHIAGAGGLRRPYAQPLARTAGAAKAFQLPAVGHRAALWAIAAASAAIRDLRQPLVRALTQLKRHWAEHTSAGGPPQPLPVVGGHSVTLAAKLGALIGVR